MTKEKKGILIVMVCIIITIGGMIWLMSKQKPEITPPKIEKSTIQKQIDPIAQMQKRLGSKWEKIEMVQGKWYGPYEVKTGSKWKIPDKKGNKILIKTTDERGRKKIYMDGPNVRIKAVDVVKLSFYSKTGSWVVFLKH